MMAIPEDEGSRSAAKRVGAQEKSAALLCCAVDFPVKQRRNPGAALGLARGCPLARRRVMAGEIDEGQSPSAIEARGGGVRSKAPRVPRVPRVLPRNEPLEAEGEGRGAGCSSFVDIG